MVLETEARKGLNSGNGASLCKCWCFTDGNEGSQMGSTVTAAVIGVIVPIGECGPHQEEQKDSSPRVWEGLEGSRTVCAA